MHPVSTEAVVYVLACSTLVFALFSFYLLMELARVRKLALRSVDLGERYGVTLDNLLPTLSIRQREIVALHLGQGTRGRTASTR